jgi:hypothetical protein
LNPKSKKKYTNNTNMEQIARFSFIEITREITHDKEKPLKIKGLSRVFVVPPGIEPGTHGFSVHCSTN